MRLCFGLLVIVGLLIGICLNAHAQTSINGSLRGRIIDINGAAVASATVTLTNAGTNIRRLPSRAKTVRILLHESFLADTRLWLKSRASSRCGAAINCRRRSACSPKAAMWLGLSRIPLLSSLAASSSSERRNSRISKLPSDQRPVASTLRLLSVFSTT